MSTKYESKCDNCGHIFGSSGSTNEPVLSLGYEGPQGRELKEDVDFCNIACLKQWLDATFPITATPRSR